MTKIDNSAGTKAIRERIANLDRVLKWNEEQLRAVVKKSCYYNTRVLEIIDRLQEQVDQFKADVSALAASSRSSTPVNQPSSKEVRRE